MMEIDDDKLIREFMHAEKKEVADNGFTDKVMARLPQKSSVLLVVAGVAVLVAAAILFVISGAAQGLILMVRDVVVGLIKEGTLFTTLRAAAVLFIGLIVLAYQKLSSIS